MRKVLLIAVFALGSATVAIGGAAAPLIVSWG